MKKQISRISILHSSKIVTAFYGLFGLVYTLIGALMIIFGGKQFQIMGFFYLAGPIFMAIFGFIFFVIGAAIYNLLASVLGGIEFETKEVE